MRRKALTWDERTRRAQLMAQRDGCARLAQEIDAERDPRLRGMLHLRLARVLEDVRVTAARLRAAGVRT